jgi:hypothetical protein
MGCHKTSVNNYQIRCCVSSQDSEDLLYTAADTCNLAYRIRVCWRWWHAVLWRFSWLVHCVPSVSFNASNSCNISPNFHIFFIARHPYVGVCLLSVEVSRSYSDTPHSIGLFWTSDRSVAETSTWQHTTITRKIHPCHRRESNPQSKQENDRRHTPYTARPLGSDFILISYLNIKHILFS